MQAKNIHASWQLAVVFVVCSSEDFWLTHGQCGGTVVGIVASQQKGSWFKPKVGDLTLG